MKPWIVSSLDEENIQGEVTNYSREETIWGNTVYTTTNAQNWCSNKIISAKKSLQQSQKR